MFTIRRIFNLFLVSLFILPFGLILPVYAQSSSSTSEEYNLDTDYTNITAKQEVKDQANVTKERIAFGQDVVITGSTEKNLIVAGGKVEINGNVEGSLFVAGAVVIVNGKVNGNLYAAGSEVYLNSEVTGDVFLAAANNYIGSSIKESQLHASNSTRMDYTTKVTSINDSRFDSVNYSQSASNFVAGMIVLGILFKILMFISTLLFGILLAWFLGKKLNMVESTISMTSIGDFFLKALIGTLVMFGIWIASFALLFTGIGTLIAIVTILIMILATIFFHFVGYYVVGSYIGRLVPALSSHKILKMVIGILVMGVLSIIPIVGGIAGIIHYLISIWAFGMMITQRNLGMDHTHMEEKKM